MHTKIIEATNGPFNWGKFMLARFDIEWMVMSNVGVNEPRPLLASIGWGFDTNLIWVLDLQTREGAAFRVGPSCVASDDLQKHKIWVCPLFESFLNWLYQQNVADFDALPEHIDLPDAEFAFRGYRRPGPVSESER